MSGRITALGGGGRLPVTAGIADVLTPAMVDQAVDTVLEGEEPDMKKAIIGLWSGDHTSEVAQMLQSALLARQTRQKYSAAGKTQMTVYSAMSPDQVKRLTVTHPDYDFRYEFTSVADHGLAGTVRKAGSKRLIGRIPAGMRYADIGGSITDHVDNADTNCVVVSKIIDQHDPMRAVLTNARLVKLVGGVDVEHTTRGRISQSMAASVLRGEGKYHVEAGLEQMDFRILAGIMVHVYDVPITAIPHMMERCGMLVLEGTMHFSNRFFLEDSGVLPDVDARFQVDREGDVFRMGFVDSPVLWYEHKWSEFRRYGADQILVGRTNKFSYKIIERRGDTIDFRVLRIGGSTQPETEQYYADPAVPMVEVVGSRVDSGGGGGSVVQDIRRFPVATWEAMVRHAAVEAAKGTLDYNAHAGIYLTLTAGDTYNGTTAAVGRVPMDDLPALVVWSAVYAVGEVMLLRRGVRTMVDLEMQSRDVSDIGIMNSLSALFGAVGQSVGRSYLAVYNYLGGYSSHGYAAADDKVLQVRPVPRMVRVPSELLEKGVGNMPLSAVSSFVHAEHLERRAQWDDAMLDVERRVKASELADVDKGVTTVDGFEQVTDTSSTAVENGSAPSWMPVIEEWETYKYCGNDCDTAQVMQSAVKEEIQLCIDEVQKLEAFFTDAYSKVVTGRTADGALLERRAEAWRDADLWWIEDNVVIGSELGRRSEDFDYGGLYVPAPDSVVDITGVTTQTNLRPVLERSWTGIDAATREKTTRTHWMLDGPAYTGWAMSNRELAVFNGRQVIAGLQVALRCSFAYETGCYEGGPGCGKTTHIASQHSQGDFVISPLVMSVKDIRARLVKEKKTTALESRNVARTFDSLLVAVGRVGRIPQGFPRADVVRCDEIFNGRLGRAYACFALLGAKRVIGYGDKLQIPPVVRADVDPVHVAYRAMHVVVRHVVFRGAPEIVSCFNGHYGDTLRTLSKKKGVVTVHKSCDGISPRGSYLLLCMNQATKKILHAMFPNAGDRIKTVHESQGAEADDVYLFCFDLQKRALDDLFHLYNSPCYVNVGISRARTGFHCVNMSPNRDLVMVWLDRGRDPVLIALSTYQ